MKTRHDFVSNSSSSSFVLLGKVMDYDKFTSAVKAAGFSFDGDEDDGPWVGDYAEWIDDKTDGFLSVEGDGYDGEYYNALVGADPSKMKDDETLKQFKEKVIAALASVGIEAKAKDISFQPGGSDASGQSWIGSCG